MSHVMDETLQSTCHLFQPRGIGGEIRLIFIVFHPGSCAVCDAQSMKACSHRCLLGYAFWRELSCLGVLLTLCCMRFQFQFKHLLSHRSSSCDRWDHLAPAGNIITHRERYSLHFVIAAILCCDKVNIREHAENVEVYGGVWFTVRFYSSIPGVVCAFCLTNKIIFLLTNGQSHQWGWKHI